MSPLWASGSVVRQDSISEARCDLMIFKNGYPLAKEQAWPVVLANTKWAHI